MRALHILFQKILNKQTLLSKYFIRTYDAKPTREPCCYQPEFTYVHVQVEFLKCLVTRLVNVNIGGRLFSRYAFDSPSFRSAVAVLSAKCRWVIARGWPVLLTKQITACALSDRKQNGHHPNAPRRWLSSPVYRTAGRKLLFALLYSCHARVHRANNLIQILSGAALVFN